MCGDKDVRGSPTKLREGKGWVQRVREFDVRVPLIPIYALLAPYGGSVFSHAVVHFVRRFRLCHEFTAKTREGAILVFSCAAQSTRKQKMLCMLFERVFGFAVESHSLIIRNWLGAIVENMQTLSLGCCSRAGDYVFFSQVSMK